MLSIFLESTESMVKQQTQCKGSYSPSHKYDRKMETMRLAKLSKFTYHGKLLSVYINIQLQENGMPGIQCASKQELARLLLQSAMGSTLDF